ncbi:MAG: hypothetical protein IKD77_00860 [Bacilli bacterium]|nr:hypothetical protein [Bacilli bacterium]
MLTDGRKKRNRPTTTTPYSFRDNVSARAAEKAVNREFPELKAYATERVLYVSDHPSKILGFAVDDFVKSLGGKQGI